MCLTQIVALPTMAEDAPTLDELRQQIADIESGKLPARRKAAFKAKASGLTRHGSLQRKTPFQRKTPLHSQSGAAQRQ